jgi:hypothetical protein
VLCPQYDSYVVEVGLEYRGAMATSREGRGSESEARSSSETGATRAYAGYEFQLLVSVWVALELLFKEKAADALELEPASQEDIEAQLRKPPRDPSAVLVPLKRLIIQVKLHGGPWSAFEFDRVLKGRAPLGGTRKSALQQLMDEPEHRYVLITDAQLPRNRQKFRVDGLLAPSRSPTLSRKIGLPKGVDRKALAQRIGVIEQQHPDRISARIRSLLSEQLLVPSMHVEACKDRLLEQARRRLLKSAAREWSRTEIIQAAESFGGSPLPGAELRAFVPPGNYEHIQTQLNRLHAVLLQGPPGAGKTQVLEKLEYEHRVQPEPFAVVPPPKTPDELREALKKQGRFFIKVVDPWGTFERGPGADRWFNELPALLKHADPDKKIVVTTREAILHSSGEDAAETFRPFAVLLTYDHYDYEARRQILENRLVGARFWQREWVRAFEQPILTTLQAPLSLDRFADKVRAIERVEDFDLDVMLRVCSVEHLASRFVEELRHLDWEAIPAAIALWGLLSLAQNSTFRMQEANSWRVLLRRYLRGVVAWDRLLAWMTAGRWLTHEEGQFHAHSTTLEGLTRILQTNPGHADEVLVALLSGLVATERLEDAHRLVKHLPRNGSIQIPAEIRVALRAHRVSQLVAGDEVRFRDLFGSARELLSDDEPVAVLMDGINGSSSRVKGRWHRVGNFIPPVWAESLHRQVQSSPEARIVASRYIRWVLPFEFHDCSGALAAWFWSLGWNLSEDFRKAVQTGVEARGGAGLGEAVHGVLMARQPAHEEWLELILRVQGDVEREDEAAYGPSRRMAQQKVLSEFDAEFWEEPSTEWMYMWEALTAAIKERRYQQGYLWIVEHPRRHALLSGWSSALAEQLPAIPLPRRNSDSEDEDVDPSAQKRVVMLPPTVEELRTFLRICIPDDAWALWNLLDSTYVADLLPELFELLVAGPPKLARKCLKALSRQGRSEGFFEQLNAGLERATKTRRAALLFLTHREDWKDWRTPEVARRFKETLIKAMSSMDGPAFQACLGVQEQELPSPGTLILLGPEEREILREWCGDLETPLGHAALVVLSMLGEDITTLAREALQSSDVASRLAAIRALARSRTTDARAALVAALGDEHYQCRQHAIQGLAPEADEAERRTILARALDESAPVREACVDAIREGLWSEGLGALCRLLTDRRNRRYGDPDINVDHHVAFAAAQALGAFPSLPSEILEALLEFLSWGLVANVDLRVHREIVQLVAPLPLPELPRVLTDLLDALAHSPGQGDTTLRYLQRAPGVNPNVLELRYQVTRGLVRHLTLHSSAREHVNVKPFGSMSSHPQMRLAIHAWLGLGVIGERGWSECRALLSQEEEHRNEKTALMVFASAVCGHSVRSRLLSGFFPESDPVWSIAAWLGEPVIPSLSAQWAARWEQAPVVRAWLQALSDAQPWQKAVRNWLEQQFGAPFRESL